MATEWQQIEPYPGFGGGSFGEPSDDETSPHYRGFGDPTTEWQEHTGD